MTYLTDVSKKMKKQAENNFQQEKATNELEVQKKTSLQKNKVGKRKQLIKSAITAKINTTGNKRSGKSYFEEYDQKKGGYWHTYDNGLRVFVSKPKTGNTTLPKKGQKGGTYKYLNRSQSA